MTIEIICSDCVDCNIIRGKICQALADLNMAADVISVCDSHHMGKYYLPGHPGIVIDGHPVAASAHCSVSELKYLLDQKVL